MVVLFFIFGLAWIFPGGWRFFSGDILVPAGVLSDLSMGFLLASLSWHRSRLMRAVFLVFWYLFQVMSRELMVAVQRMPSWHDLAYAVDPGFLKSSAAGFHFGDPGFALGLAILSVAAILIPLPPLGWKMRSAGLITGLLLLLTHGVLDRSAESHAVAARYSPFHWFIGDAVRTLTRPDRQTMGLPALPENLGTADMTGVPFFAQGQAKNVLLIVLEGIPGIYLPDIREKMQIPDNPFEMEKLAAATRDAMLVPDFVVHSQQTIRGLYAIHCGDFSKFSFAMPKALELQFNPERARQCLPAQLSARGWDTHFLQGAPLQFMNKDRAMPVMGFESVHGVEWFTKRTRTDFVWGTTDEDFFTGAGRYVQDLQAGGRPWFLSLLTVGTHQPFDATDEMVARHGSRKMAAVAQLDLALGRFMAELKQTHILDNTLVIITSDESHGAEGPDWYISWGFAAVLAPEQAALPRFKQGTYGLVDIEASILDYLGLPLPPDIMGRSFFRDYDTSRDMVSYTAGKLRWQTPDQVLYECIRDRGCRVMENTGILGTRPESEAAEETMAARVFAMADGLDNNLASVSPRMVLEFAGKETQVLPEKVMNEWTDNLIGAQYLSFPENSRVHVDIQLRVVAAGPSGIQPRLTLREFEKEAHGIEYPQFPILNQGESHRLRFDFQNKAARRAFSFHLTAAGPNAAIRFDKFEVVIDRNPPIKQ